jgi:Putative MetA-pathway of phenol degradation
MLSMVFRRLAILILALPGAVAAQTKPHACGADAQSSISTDRPQITEASTVVPCGSLQFENGFAVTGSGSQSGLDLTETWMRFGIPGKGEVRVGVPDYYTNTGVASGFSSGFGDLSLGFKQQLGPTHGFDVSLIPSLSVPTGANRISSHGYDPSLQLPWSRMLSKNWMVAGMFAAMWPTQPAGRNTTGQVTLYFDRQMTAALDAWGEYTGSFPARGGPEHVLNLGACLKPTQHQQIDFHASFGLSSAAPDYSVGLGYSVRFQAVRAH